ncbi:MAG: thioredoxin family protein [Candidatus Abyssobacteria bacterium SURF_17]|uniref:Thioredoxin family protein n=1 Tax=Candidatus Abyssobacteria bacterium SURF_17 TaxID=2093361 RepID=A0A419F9U2_9BACT|nr:MAG: thioredoxin family protein [Candidatus Abyssubacteria bacterium SURF_17]
MSEHRQPKITQINVGGHRIGLRDLEEALTNVRSKRITDESSLKQALLEEVRNMKNYIPAVMESKYEQALVREYRRFLGEPVEEEEEEGLNIQILGMGCPNCRRLTDEVVAVLLALNVAADVDHITETDEIAKYGAVGTPALVINKKIVSVGRVPTRDQIKQWLEQETKRGKE